MTRTAPLLSWLVLCAAPALAGEEGETLLLHQPTLSAEHVAFVYAGDVWVAPADGGEARRLTVLPAAETNPHFSPDGRRIAFTASYDGNTDVYVVGVDGGDPRRLTWHPGPDAARGWTRDGQRVLFTSGRGSVSRYRQLYTVAEAGGFPERLPLPMGGDGSYSPDGRRFAYSPVADAFGTWKRYRGGRTARVWIYDEETREVEKVPRENSNDTQPVWLGGEVFFLSDRNRVMNVFGYDPRTKVVRQLTFHDAFDVKSLGAGPERLVYAQAGALHTLDPATGAARRLSIRIGADLPAKRPHYVEAAASLRGGSISPTGQRAVVEARGEILTVPVKKGSDRNLTRTTDVHERDPAWSPDGARIACLSDAGGEYHLAVYDQKGMSEPELFELGDAPSFYYGPAWSPEGEKILYTDKRLSLWVLDLESKENTKVDTDTYDHPQRTLAPVWSPDSRWIAYTKRLPHHYRAVFLYELESGQTHQVTDGLSDATSAAFDRDGKYLYFTASTDFGLNTGWLDMSSYERPARRSLYLAVLSKEEPSPFAHESDEEPVEEEEAEQPEEDAEESDAEESEESGEAAQTEPEPASEEGAAGEEEEEELEEPEEEPMQVDLEGIGQRILALPIPAGRYASLQAADGGALLYTSTPEGERTSSIERFDLKERKSETLMSGVGGFAVSHDGKKLLYAQGRTWGIVGTQGKAKVGDGKLKLDAARIHVDPPAEWAQMFDEVWRIERDYFYDPGMHGLDWAATKAKYAPFLEHVASRADLNFLFAEMIGEMVVGHNYVGGGDQPSVERVPGGLLGCDFAVTDGRYQITRIYDGENWNPELRAPLTEPGIDVREGDFLLAVDGRPLAAPANVYALFERSAGRPVVIEVAERPDAEETRTVTVVPIGSEGGLRNRAWIEDNRRRVQEASGGRVAYVYLPDTAGGGYSYFTRYYFSQLGCEAAVIDERFNGGGSAADYIVDLLDRPLLSNWATREGGDFTTPLAAIFGPKVMIINEYAGSGGDALPLYFRRRGIGQLVGTTTWGGLVGIYDYPPLIDGGFVMAPRVAIFSPDGEWEVENAGVPPDVEVEWLPADYQEGRDAQLEKALEVVLEELERNPVPSTTRRPYPRRAR